jgi:hypothetical protein
MKKAFISGALCLLFCGTAGLQAQSKQEFTQDILQKEYAASAWENRYKRPAPFSVNNGKLRWTNITSTIRFILFHRFLELLPKGNKTASVSLEISGAEAWSGTTSMGLAVFDSVKANSKTPGNGFFFGVKNGFLLLDGFKNNQQQKVELAKIKVNPGVKLKMSRNSDNLYEFSYNNGDEWKTCYRSDLFKVSSDAPKYWGIYGASGWWKGWVECKEPECSDCTGEAWEKRDVSCWILSSQKELLDLWQHEFKAFKIKCALKDDFLSFNGKTDLSKLKIIILDARKIQETFARKLESWVEKGGVLIVTGIPSEYAKVSYSGDKLAAKEYTVPWVQTKVARKKRNTILRATSVTDFMSGELIDVKIPADSALDKYAGETKTFTIKTPKLKCSGITLVTGWPDRVFGDMSLVTASLKNKEKKTTDVTVISRHNYGKGIGIYYKLPASGNEPAFEAVRKAVIAYAANFKPKEKNRESLFSVANAPGKKAEAKEKFVKPVPERPTPPKDCILEAHGDTFTSSSGSPGWAPWRIALAFGPHTPVSKKIELKDNNCALWMKVKAAYGDHREAPPIEVKFNDHTLIKGICPWSHIQYSAKNYDAMFPVWIYIPKEIIKKENDLTFINYGPEWWLLDYVQFYKAEGENSLSAWQKKDKPGKYEAKAIDGNVTLDGKLDDEAWKQAFWKNFESQSSGKETTSFALVNGKDYLYVGFKCPYKNKSNDNVVELAVSWPGCQTNYVFAYRDNGQTSLRSIDGDIITGANLKGESFDDKEKKMRYIEMAIPWNYLPIDSLSQQYRPALKRFLPEGGIMSINAFRKIKGSKDSAAWTSWLPFIYQGEQKTSMQRTYKTRLPYQYIYEAVEKGTAYGLTKRSNSVEWPSQWNWGNNKIKLKDNDTTKVEIQIRNNRKEVYNGIFAGKDIRIPLVFPGENDIIIKEFNQDGKLKNLSMRPADVELPCQLMLGKSFYTTEKTATLVLKIHDPKQFKQQVDRIQTELVLPGGKVINAGLNKNQIPDADLISLPLDISSAPDGSYEVAVNLTVAGQRINLKPLTLQKLPVSATEVKVRADGVTEINGKPFFPFGMCLTGFSMHDSIKTVTDAGINFVIPWGGYKYMNKEKWDKFCEEAEENKVYLAINPTERMNGAGNWLIDYENTAEFVKGMKDYPAVLGYYPIDEPEYWHAPNCTPQKLKEFNNFVRKLDPYRPHMMSHAVGGVHYGESEGMVFNDAVDIRIWECYGKPSAIISRMDEMKKVGKNDRVVSWAFLRTGTGWGFNGMDPQAFRANAYAAIIAGCKGIVYFEMRTSRWTGHELWPKVFKKVSDEMQELATSFMKESSKDIKVKILEGNKLSRAKAWIDGDDIYLVVVNAEESKDHLKIELPFEVSGDGGPLFIDMPKAKIKNNMVEIELDRYATGAYKLKKSAGNSWIFW